MYFSCQKVLNNDHISISSIVIGSGWKTTLVRCSRNRLDQIQLTKVKQSMNRIIRYSFGSQIKSAFIRNFCIIAHIDHGKSTLADRLLQLTDTIPKNSQSQFLDKLKVERQRGITVQAQTVSMNFIYQQQKYLLNLVDTPGHVDFHYEVERSMRGCQGALLLVDASQGVQAQTLANFELAKRQNLIVLPILNKIDAICDIPMMESEIRIQLGLQNHISKISAKTGLNVEQILIRIIQEIPPPPVGLPTEKLKVFLINSWFVNGKNVVCLFYIMSGELKKGTTLISCSSGKSYQVFQVGLLQPQFSPEKCLYPGQIGYSMSNMKEVKQARIGDTFHKIGEKVQPEPGFKPSKPMMFAGVYPLDPDEFGMLEKNLQKLVLTDPAVSFIKESNATLGNGFRCGFLGMLHMDVFKQRLDDEFSVEAMLTSPSVPYYCKIKNQQKKIYIESAADAPGTDKAQYFEEPMVISTIVSPLAYASSLKSLCENRRGKFIQEILTDHKNILKFRLPLSEIIVDFVDRVKSLTHGYGSFQYEHDGFEKSEIVKMVIHIMNDPVDALTFLVHEKKAYEFGKRVCSKVKETIPQQLFMINIQARIGSKTIAKEEIPHVKKHVTAKCYGGDYSRKRKLLDRYKEGKKKLRSIGKVQVGKETFLHVMKQ